MPSSKRRRVAVIGIFHETNVFSPFVTDKSRFARTYHTDELIDAFDNTSTVVGGFLQGTRESRLDVVPVFGAYASPSGVVTPEAIQWLREELCQHLKRAGQVDGVLLELHGAMVGQDLLDPEEEILHLIRRQWPGVPVACVLDLRAA